MNTSIISKDYTLARFIEGARLAERLGFHGYGGGDHVAFGGPMPDILTLLAAVAAVTTGLRLKTGVYVLPWRPPVQIASQVATLDRISGGRVTFGVGVGETEEEFRAFGVPMTERGRRTDETIDCLRLLWSGERVSYQGTHLRLDAVRVQLTPVQSPLPIYIGGRSDIALRRAATRGDGYTAIWCSPRRLAEAKEKIAQWSIDAGRAADHVRVGMQVWACVAASREAARDVIARDMSQFYGIPFDRFERYVAYGTADDVAGFLGPYLETGIDHLNLVPIDPDPLEQIAKLAGVVRGLGQLAAPHPTTP
jgi:probable F420-dependent oxidoreductase